MGAVEDEKIPRALHGPSNCWHLGPYAHGLAVLDPLYVSCNALDSCRAEALGVFALDLGHDVCRARGLHEPHCGFLGSTRSRPPRVRFDVRDFGALSLG